MYESILTETAEIERQLELARYQNPSRAVRERGTRLARLRSALRPTLPKPRLRPSDLQTTRVGRGVVPWAGPGGSVLP